MRIDSFIATVGMSSVLLAGISWVSGSQQILNLGSSFSDVATGQLLGLTYPVWMMLLMLALIPWYVTDWTAVARRVHATGVKGLQRVGAPVWILDLFSGLALLLAVGMAEFRGTAGRGGAVGRMVARPRPRSGADQDSTTQDQSAAGPVSVP